MIVFDLDDTLYKEFEYVDSGIQAVAREAEDIGVMSAKDAYDLIKTSPDTASGFDRLAAIALNKDTGKMLDIQRILAVYRYHLPQITLPESHRKLLVKLKNDGVNLGLITDGRSASQRLKIKALGLDLVIPDENILISSEVGADKHWPNACEEMMRRNPGEKNYAYIGDNPQKDFLWPNKLGWTTIMLRDTYHVNIYPQNLTDLDTDSPYHARHTVDHLPEILTILNPSDY